MKRILFIVLLLIPSEVLAALPVIDTAAIAQLIQQIKQTIEVITQLEKLNDWADIDHINLAGGKFGRFLCQYERSFQKILNQIESYQNGGAFGQIGRIASDDIYPGYHAGWESADEFGGKWRNLKKQVLWTKIQMKHAALVGSKVRDSLDAAQKEREILLDDTLQSVGILQAIKIGNQLTGTLGNDLQKLNVQLGEFLQAYSAKELEENYKRGLQANRLEEAFTDFGLYEGAPELPRIPVGAYK